MQSPWHSVLQGELSAWSAEADLARLDDCPTPDTAGLRVHVQVQTWLREARGKTHLVQGDDGDPVA